MHEFHYNAEIKREKPGKTSCEALTQDQLYRCESQSIFDSYNAAYAEPLDEDEMDCINQAEELHLETLDDEVW